MGKEGQRGRGMGREIKIEKEGRMGIDIERGGEEGGVVRERESEEGEK